MSSATASAPDRVQAIIKRGVKLPPLSPVGFELLSASTRSQNHVEIRRLAQLIERDPALTVRLLRLSNSPYFGVSERVTNIRHAIALIGLREAMDFLTFTVVREGLPEFPPLPHFTLEGFWSHSLACATAARLMGNPQYLVRAFSGELHLAGLLHDIGKVVLALQMPDDFRAALALAHERGWPLWQAEQEVLGFDHAELGARLLETWKVAPSTLAAIAHHHRPEGAPAEGQEIAAVVELANVLANSGEVGDGGSPAERDLKQTLIARRGDSVLASEAIQQSLARQTETQLRRETELYPAATRPPEPAAENEPPLPSRQPRHESCASERAVNILARWGKRILASFRT